MKKIIAKIKLACTLIAFLMLVALVSALLIIATPFAPEKIFYIMCNAANDFSKKTGSWRAMFIIKNISKL